jgi:SAM-dependent methyltransferase
MKITTAIESVELMRVMFDGLKVSAKMKKFFDAELQGVFDIVGKDEVLVIGCGYGREMARLDNMGTKVWGLDKNASMLFYGYYDYLKNHDTLKNRLYNMNAANIEWKAAEFDWAVWIQNGLFGVYEDKRTILREMMRVSRKGIIISTFHPAMLEERKRWLAKHNETGEILHIDGTGTTYLHFRPPIEMYNEPLFTSLFQQSFHPDNLKYIKYMVKPIKNMSLFFILEWRNQIGKSTGNSDSASKQLKASAKKRP